MFKNLTNRLSQIFEKIGKQGRLSQEDVSGALREVRIALLEADVALPVVKDFIENVQEKATGQDLIKAVAPGQMVIKIVHDHLIEILGKEAIPLNLAGDPPTVIMMVGLQGTGKTTSTAKLAKYLAQKKRKKVLMASVDIYRPSAQDQLAVLANELNLDCLPIIKDQSPLDISHRAYEKARLEGYDVLLLDTAGRLQIDETLMDELDGLKNRLNPQEVLLVADAMSGQDAVNVADSFHKKVGLTGILLTRIDGDARGGASLSMRSVTGCPIKFLGTGERLDQLEEYHPDRIANRILDKGDVVSLVEQAMETVDQQDAENLAKKMEKGRFDLNDMATQLKQISKMGGVGSIMGMMPGMGKFKDKLQGSGFEDKVIKKQLAIIQSMTKTERRDYRMLKAARKRRVSMGSGTSVHEVNKLLDQFKKMQTMMKRMQKMGKKGLLRDGIKGLFS